MLLLLLLLLLLLVVVVLVLLLVVVLVVLLVVTVVLFLLLCMACLQVDHQVREAEAESRQFFELWAPDQTSPPRSSSTANYLHRPAASTATASSGSHSKREGAALYAQHPLGSPYRNSRVDNRM